MFVLIVGCGRVGSAIARHMHRQGHDVSVLDENPEAHALLEQDIETSWEEAGGMFTVGTALEVDALREAGIERADVVVCSTDGDNTNIVVAQVARKRFQVPKVVVRVLDPLRAQWYSDQGLHTVCPTQVAIEMLTEAVTGEAVPAVEEAF
jgi:trk system potassium uptake protein TrkA